MLRMGSVFVSIAITFHSFALSAAKVPLSALEFRCCKPKGKDSAVSRGTMTFR